MRTQPRIVLIHALAIFSLHTLTLAQETYRGPGGRLREMILDTHYKTIQLYREGWPLSYPVIRLQGDVPLVLEFDDISEDQPALGYRIIHCNADWTRSDLIESEYMEGFSRQNLRNGRPSFNTYYSYLHYSAQIPGKETRLLVSGNYILEVYKEWDPGSVVFTKRFMVTEGRVDIRARAKIPDLSMYRGCCHEVDFTVNHAGIRIDDPFSEVRASIYQNGLWDLGIEGLQPYMVNNQELVYDFQQENIFPGGNEYRFFDTKNTRIPTYYVEEIDYIDPYFHFRLKPDTPNPPHLYFSHEDINGRFFIESEGGTDPGVDADYVYVHFTLKMPQPMRGSVFIAGGLTGWQFGDMNRMAWNNDEGAYVKTLLLKQGVYNYRYLFLPQGGTQFVVEEIEGSHYETENEYLILFYHRPPGSRYDHLLGHQVIHSSL